MSKKCGQFKVTLRTGLFKECSQPWFKDCDSLEEALRLLKDAKTSCSVCFDESITLPDGVLYTFTQEDLVYLGLGGV